MYSTSYFGLNSYLIDWSLGVAGVALLRGVTFVRYGLAVVELQGTGVVTCSELVSSKGGLKKRTERRGVFTGFFTAPAKKISNLCLVVSSS